MAKKSTRWLNARRRSRQLQGDDSRVSQPLLQFASILAEIADNQPRNDLRLPKNESNENTVDDSGLKNNPIGEESNRNNMSDAN